MKTLQEFKQSKLSNEEMKDIAGGWGFKGFCLSTSEQKYQTAGW
ncbi:MAG: TIGR04149 family rSAM-modified RiPP [Cyclobacteriaceae bacterium]|nr:TIGR04149 family rSAM-modified RiPP [Cyclobacteriaceae bacterium]